MANWSNGLQPWLRPYAEALMRYAPGARITSVYRSMSDQARLYANRANNPYPVAAPGHSYHNYGRAWDVSAPAETLNWLGRVWESWGGTWGGRFHDNIHFQA